MRKTVLTGALVLFGAGTTLQLLAALAVCILWLALVANLKPYAEGIDDRLAQVEGLQVLFTLLVGLVLQLQQASALASEGTSGGAQSEVLLGLFLIAFNIVVVTLAVAQQPIVHWAARKAMLPLRARCCPNHCSCLDDAAAAAQGAHRAPSHAGGAGRTSAWAANPMKALPAGGHTGVPAPALALAPAAADTNVTTTASGEAAAAVVGAAVPESAAASGSQESRVGGKAPQDALAEEARSILTSFRT